MKYLCGVHKKESRMKASVYEILRASLESWKCLNYILIKKVKPE